MSLDNLLLLNSSEVTNTKIVCKDGIISSHKILVASTSKFIKNIMLDANIDDEDMTLILPDFTNNEVNEMLKKVLNGNYCAPVTEEVNIVKQELEEEFDDDGYNEDFKPHVKMEEIDNFDNDLDNDFEDEDEDIKPGDVKNNFTAKQSLHNQAYQEYISGLY